MSETVDMANVDDILLESIMAIFEQHTDYSAEDLDLNADFESDLGIDSILLASILADLYKLFEFESKKIQNGLPDTSGLTNLGRVADHIKACYAEEGRSISVHAVRGYCAHATPHIVAAETTIAGDVTMDSADGGKQKAAEDTQSRNKWSPFIEKLTQDISNESVLNLIDSEKRFQLTFSASGFEEKDLAELHEQLRNQHGTPDIIHLSECDTPEKLQAYLGAARQHQVEQLSLVNDRNKEQAASYPEDDDPRTMRDFVNLPHKDLFYKTKEFKTFYTKKKQQQLYWYGMPLESRCENRAIIYDEITGKRREFLMFASNNYLGLANHPEVIDAIGQGAKKYGATNTGCRLIGGSNVLHKELENRLAKLKGRESCIVYPSGYSANLGCISAIAGNNDLVFSDAINHMSIQDGCKLSGSSRKIYQHSMDSLEKVLRKYADHDGGKLIVTDGVFSMHGDIVDLPKLLKLAKQYGARVLVDDAHSTGVLGKTGSGTAEHFDKKGEVDFELGTMSKALAGVGGFVCGDEDVIEYLRFYSNSYVFAATIPAAVAAGLIASIDVMEREPQRLRKLWDNIHRLRSHLLDTGFDLEHSNSAIIPVVVGNDRKTLEFGRAVRARGMFCQTVVFPGVAVGDARLRISVTSEHTAEDLDFAAQILVDAAKEVNIS